MCFGVSDIQLIAYFWSFQLQEAFAKGLLKPGMNVRVDKSKKYVNNVVSDRVNQCEVFVAESQNSFRKFYKTLVLHW